MPDETLVALAAAVVAARAENSAGGFSGLTTFLTSANLNNAAIVLDAKQERLFKCAAWQIRSLSSAEATAYGSKSANDIRAPNGL